MSERTDTPLSAAPWSAERLLLGTLELIKQSKSVHDISPELLAKHLHEPVTTYAPGNFGYHGTLTPEWDFILKIKYAGTDRTLLDLSISDTTDKRSSTATDICQVDFDRFSSELEKAGFTRDTVFGEHGHVISDFFYRPGLSVNVATRGEASQPLDKAQHSCVQSVVAK